MNAKTASTVLLVFAAALLAAVLFFAGAAWRARITAGALTAPIPAAVTKQAGREGGLFSSDIG